MLSGAPSSNDKELINVFFAGTCNCYAYAVQDYFAGSLGKNDMGYLPRPGQSQGRSYSDLLGKNVDKMRQALSEDGVLYVGMKYPKKIPEDKYVICCFLEPHEYHFLRQNQDGSWSGKDGLADVSTKDVDGKALINPENFYHQNPDYPFCGYFFVPKGGLIVGLRAYEKKLLSSGRISDRQEKILKDSVDLTDKSKKIKQDICEYFQKNNLPAASLQMELYRGMLDKLSQQCQRMNYFRRSILKVISPYSARQR